MGYLGRSPTPSPIDSSDIPDNSIDASKIIDGAIAVADVADNAITEAKIADAAVVSLKSGRKNLIINGDMKIDQRNSGAVTSISSGSPAVTVDRFQGDLNLPGSVLSVQQVSDTPAGFDKSAKVTCTTSQPTIASSYSYLRQNIEGYNFAHLNFGSANAKTFTLSFWVKSSLTGLFGGYLGAAFNARFRLFDYTISLADTWEYKTVTITGDSAGVWNTTNLVGLQVAWSLSCGSSYLGATGSWGSSLLLGVTGQTNIMETTGATFQMTGVQLEVGSVATDFEHRSYGEELALCQRYYEKITWAICPTLDVGNPNRNYIPAHSVWMRAPPTVTLSSPATGNSNETYEFSSGQVLTITSVSTGVAYPAVSAYFQLSTSANRAQYVTATFSAEL